MEFNTFCNICFRKKDLRKIKENERLTQTLMIFIENKMVIQGQDIYLCLNCCEKLKSYDQFKEMCLRNFIDFRVQYYELKNKLESNNDPYVENKLKNFIETKVSGSSSHLKVVDSEDIRSESNIIYMQESENESIGKEGNSCSNYDFDFVNCKTEKVDWEDDEEYELQTEIDLENGTDKFKESEQVEGINGESYSEGSVRFETVKIECDDSELYLYNSEDNFELPERVEPINTEDSGSTESSSKNKRSRRTKSTQSRKRNQKIRSSNKSPQLENKKFPCGFCNKIYTRLAYLKEHIGVHTGDQPFVCKICDKAFTSSTGLKKHIPIHTDEKPFTCSECNTSFKTLHNLKGHQRVHTGEKPFGCTMCEQRFTKLHSYKTHMLIHTGEKPHTCTVCNKSFRQLSTLKEHERIHTGDEPYKCDKCKKTFSRRNYLRLHKKRPCTLCKRKSNQSL